MRRDPPLPRRAWELEELSSPYAFLDCYGPDLEVRALGARGMVVGARRHASLRGSSSWVAPPMLGLPRKLGIALLPSRGVSLLLPTRRYGRSTGRMRCALWDSVQCARGGLTTLVGWGAVHQRRSERV